MSQLGRGMPNESKASINFINSSITAIAILRFDQPFPTPTIPMLLHIQKIIELDSLPAPNIPTRRTRPKPADHKAAMAASPSRRSHDPAYWLGGGDIHIPHATVAVLDYGSPGNPTRHPRNCGTHPTASVCVASDVSC